MAKTSREAWRHYGAILDFFGAVEDVVSGEAWEKFMQGYKEYRALRQSFKRLIERGFIRKDTKGWKFTPKGMREFRRTRAQKVRHDRGVWDGKWRLITFDVPVADNAKRRALRALLVEFDFLPLQKSVWVSPHAAEDALTKLMVKSDVWRFCKLMVVDIVEGDDELKKRFKLLPTRRE